MLALEVKGIPYDTVLVDLRNKPEWYLKAVPTGLTPAARIKGTLMWESAGGRRNNVEDNLQSWKHPG